MKKNWLILSTGFALFSMFFGSGNLVFPITVGYESQGHYNFAALGILLTGVMVPFLGTFGMMLYQGDFKSFFRFFGKTGTFLFSFAALALLGPFGVTARCLTVTHGALMNFFPEAPSILTGLLMSVAIFIFALNQGKIISRLGSWLTPLLLISIFAIAIFGITQGTLAEPISLNWLESFENGFFQGYQTMDLLAAFFFSQFLIKHLFSQVSTKEEEREAKILFCKSSFIAASLLAAVYFALVLLGWIYFPILQGTPPEAMLGKIALASLGSMAAPCVCLAVIFACLTTAIVLTVLFSDFLRKEIFREKLGNETTLVITLVIGFLVSTLEFSGIAKFLGPVLETIYPILIILTVINILNYGRNKFFRKESVAYGKV